MNMNRQVTNCLEMPVKLNLFSSDKISYPSDKSSGFENLTMHHAIKYTNSLDHTYLS